MKDYAVAFGEPKSHGCIFNVPRVGGFFRVVLRIWGSFAGSNAKKKARKIQRCGAGG
ncbi:MAG: hypothetical protein IJ284_02345 [Clostridia bacterium]|nr:hypothetical protein [Clostridia bacterium]